MTIDITDNTTLEKIAKSCANTTGLFVEDFPWAVNNYCDLVKYGNEEVNCPYLNRDTYIHLGHSKLYGCKRPRRKK